MSESDLDPTANPPAEPTAPAAPEPTDPPEKDWKAEYEKQREHARTWETRAKENKTAADRLAELEAEKLTALEKAEKERDEAKARAEQVEKTSRDLVINAAVRELAGAQQFHNPAAALALLKAEGKLDSIKVDASGELDRAPLQEALADLATREPYLVAAAGPRAPQPDPSQGARSTSASAAEDAEYEKYFPPTNRK